VDTQKGEYVEGIHQEEDNTKMQRKLRRKEQKEEMND
jgi:hypothetical protein